MHNKVFLSSNKSRTTYKNKSVFLHVFYNSPGGNFSSTSKPLICLIWIARLILHESRLGLQWIIFMLQSLEHSHLFSFLLLVPGLKLQSTGQKERLAFAYFHKHFKWAPFLHFARVILQTCSQWFSARCRRWSDHCRCLGRGKYLSSLLPEKRETG